jgi:5S rRNA maturation endonuclease (ribonuclease M5)
MSPKEAESLFLELIEEAGRTVDPEKNGKEWKFCCPFHADSTPSCNYSPALGTFHCFGCDEKGTSYKLFMKLAELTGTEKENTIRRIAAHLGKTVDYVPPDSEAIRISSYCDKRGRLVKQEVRYPDRPDGSKDIRQRRPGGNGEFIWNVKGLKPMLYNLQYLESAGVIVICEGPKDADTVTDLCLSGGRFVVVGTTSGGAGTWDDSLVKDVGKYKKVVILPDDDEPGAAYADAVVRSLQSAGIDYRRISFEGTGCKDVSEYMACHSIEDIVRLIGADWVDMPDGRRLTRIPVAPLDHYNSRDNTKGQSFSSTTA